MVESKSQKILEANAYVNRSYRGKTGRKGGRGGGGVFSASPILGSTTKESYQFVNFIKNII